MPRPARCALVAVAALAALTALTACTRTTDDPNAVSLPDGVEVVLVQLRSDVASRDAQVEVHNGTDDALTIGDVAVTDPRFAAPAERALDRTTVIPPGRTVDIRVHLPEMACDPDEGESIVTLTYELAGASGTGQAPIADTRGFLPPLHERECRAQALTDAAAVSLAEFHPSPPGLPAALVLRVAPTGAATARILSIRPTNLLQFGFAVSAAYPINVEVGPGSTEVTDIHVPLTAVRCDPHAVLEDKRGTVFALLVQVDGVPEQIELAASEEMRGRILTWVADWCGFPQG